MTLCVEGINFLVYCVNKSFVLVTVRFDSKRCVMLIEQVTSDKVKREGIIEGHGGTNTALSYSCVACVHTLLCIRTLPGKRRGKITGTRSKLLLFLILHSHLYLKHVYGAGAGVNSPYNPSSHPPSGPPSPDYFSSR